MWARSLSQEDHLEEEMTTLSIFLPGESHGQRSLVVYSPWGHKESDMTEYMRKLNSCSKNSMIIYLYRIYNLQGNMQTQAKCQDSGLCSSCC